MMHMCVCAPASSPAQHCAPGVGGSPRQRGGCRGPNAQEGPESLEGLGGAWGADQCYHCQPL